MIDKLIRLTVRGAMDLTKDRGQWRSFIRTHRPIVAKWLASRTDDDDHNVTKSARIAYIYIYACMCV